MNGCDNLMNNDKKIADTYQIIEILENATVIFNDGNRTLFDAIHITDKIVIIGRIMNHEEFMESGGIPKHNIKNIEASTKRKVSFSKI